MMTGEKIYNGFLFLLFHCTIIIHHPKIVNGHEKSHCWLLGGKKWFIPIIISCFLPASELSWPVKLNVYLFDKVTLTWKRTRFGTKIAQLGLAQMTSYQEQVDSSIKSFNWTIFDREKLSLEHLEFKCPSVVCQQWHPNKWLAGFLHYQTKIWYGVK